MKKCREQGEAVKAVGVGSELNSDILMVVGNKTIYIKSTKRA